jgi:hypothetical protein
MYQNKALALAKLGQVRAALPFYDRAIAIFERLVKMEGRAELTTYLAMVYQNKAAALRQLGQLRPLHTVLDSSPLTAQQATPVRTSGNASPGNAALSVGAIDVYFATSSDTSDTDDGKSETDSRPSHSGQSKTVSERSESTQLRKS